jgi:uncharacterized membrane protein/thiol-disulfide isomerase/thioredoxin
MALVKGGIQDWIPVILTCIKSLGCYIGVLLLWYEIDNQNASLQKICKAGKKMNCHAILNSAASRILGIVSWSEIGFIYFTGSLLALLASGFSDSYFILQSWLNVLSLPFIVFSFYYQWRVVKQWCVLCITVAALLVLEFLVNVRGLRYEGSGIDGPGSVKVLFFLLLPAFGWSLLKSSLLKVRENRNIKSELRRLKYDSQIFKSLLFQRKEVDSDVSGLGITLGNANGKLKLIKVCNPYCDPCAKAHPDIEELLHCNPDLQVRIIFTTADPEKDKRAAPVRHLLAIAERNDELLTMQALDDWYSAPVKDYVAFANKYKMNGELLMQDHKLDAMSRWCKETEIEHTPTVFLQGYELPEV